MKKTIQVKIQEPIIVQSADLVYSHKSIWCGAGFYPLKMSFLRPRSFFDYDPVPEKLPVIVWITGGGWTEVDHNVWLPELTEFAKKGYFVASVSYSLCPTWTFPEPLMDVKKAIRYLRAHAEELNIDTDRMAVMGESAGGHLAALVGTTGHVKEFDVGENLEYSSAVTCAIPWYPCVDMMDFEGRGNVEEYDEKPQYLMRGVEIEPQSLLCGYNHVRNHPEAARAMDPCTYVTPDTPPFLILHGSGDTLVPIHNSEHLVDTLENAGVETDYVVVEGADHAAFQFVQPEVKKIILDFLDKHLKA